MELDTGPAVSVMSHEDYGRYLAHIPLRKSSVKLETHTNERICPLSIASVDVSYNDQKKTLSATSSTKLVHHCLDASG